MLLEGLFRVEAYMQENNGLEWSNFYLQCPTPAQQEVSGLL